MSRGGVFAETCAKSHAAAGAVAAELCRPYIFNCHARLAGWAIPVLRNGEPQPATIICGGVLLIAPDSPLIRHVERVAARHNVDPAALAQSVDSVPVLSRKRLRSIADFLFQMTAAFDAHASLPGLAEADAPVCALGEPEDSGAFPRTRIKETKKTKLRRVRALMRQNAEAEVVRLLRERKPDEALQVLFRLLSQENENAGDARAGTNLNVTETFARLFRSLAGGSRVPRNVYEKQSRLIERSLSRKRLSDSPESLKGVCGKFITIAEELTGEPRPRQIKSIQKFLEVNFSRKLTLGTVGKKFGIKEKALNALIRKYCGMSFTDYIASIRISEAKHLLQTTDLSIGQVARRTGFSDQSYFTKVFKSQLGSSPSEFKSKQRELSQSSMSTG